MPPELSSYRSFATPLVRFPPPTSSQPHFIISKRNHSMKIPGRKIIPLLVFILSTISILRLLRIATSTSSSTPPLPAFHPSLQRKCSPECTDVSSYLHSSPATQSKATSLTKQEFKLLSDLIKLKAPCNLLIFGMEPKYLKLSSINSGGINVFLLDNIARIHKIRANSNNTRIYKVNYPVPAKEAYELLKHARKDASCAPNSIRLQNSTCKLALTRLPEEVYRQKWDVVVVDGPSGHSLDAPGRMAAIYTAAVIARAGNITDIFVHDVDRTVEKWFSWEFLCEENLVSSKVMAFLAGLSAYTDYLPKFLVKALHSQQHTGQETNPTHIQLPHALKTTSKYNNGTAYIRNHVNTHLRDVCCIILLSWLMYSARALKLHIV